VTMTMLAAAQSALSDLRSIQNTNGRKPTMRIALPGLQLKNAEPENGPSALAYAATPECGNHVTLAGEQVAR
jgi:hypothetical protein